MSRNPIELLKRGHRSIQQLYAHINSTHVANEKQKFFNQFRKELSQHSVAEEVVMYPWIKNAVTAGDKIIHHSLDEHQSVKELLDKADGLEAGTKEFNDTLKNLMNNLSEHIKEEENVVFPRVEKTLNESNRNSLYDSLDAVLKLAPTRPHPDAPNKPPLNVIAGVGARALDSMADMTREFPTQEELNNLEKKL
eukprot:GILK01005529.1.p1 GENE.GILK01005529.1~~GILK01005529.1.p1  ORF type:complete len:194 (+),score=37.56 GILK01005529.1:154-735(+)